MDLNDTIKKAFIDGVKMGWDRGIKDALLPFPSHFPPLITQEDINKMWNGVVKNYYPTKQKK